MNWKVFVIAGVVTGVVGCGKARVGTNEAARPSVLAKKEVNNVKEHGSGEWTPGLSEDERATLFRIAQDTLEWCVAGSRGRFVFDAYDTTPKLKEKMATFVTLKIEESLRGCVGSLAPVESLHMSVHNNAVNASMRDTRFRPVSQPELLEIDVHISILSPIVDIESIDEFKIGEHGIILEKGPYRAVYLPEVAVEQNWSKEEALSSLSRKAGMSRDGWRQGCRFKVFSSVVLSRDSDRE